LENSIAIAILFLGILIIASSAYTTYENGSSQIAKAREEQLEMKHDAMKTKIEITNVSAEKTGGGVSCEPGHGGGECKLLFNITNTGDTTLNPCNWSYFIDGKLAQDYQDDDEDDEIEIKIADNCSAKKVECNEEDEDSGSYAIYPGEKKLIQIKKLNIPPDQSHRLKIVTENGVAAYAVALINYTAGCPV